MKMTFTKSLLATAIIVGLTACGSGGGSENNTTNATNTSVNTPITKVDIEKLPGQAKYSATLDKKQSSVMGDARSGTVNLIADFTEKNIVGEVNFDPSDNYDREKTGRTRQCGNFYSSCTPYQSVGNYATVELENTTLTNNNGVLAFNGKASGLLYNNSRGTKIGSHYKDSDGIDIEGTYQGQISGQRGEKISGKLDAKSHEDVRYAVNGVFNGEKVSEIQREKPATEPTETTTVPTGTPPTETITVPTVTPSTENKSTEMVWGELPAIPKFETSTVSGYDSKLKGKATYFSQNVHAYAHVNGEHLYSKADGKSYIIVNADFDNKSINGSAAFNLYTYDNGRRDTEVKKAQAELTFKNTALYKASSNLTFNGESSGKLLTESLKENLSGSYSGSSSYRGNRVYLQSNASSPSKNITIGTDDFLYKQ